MTNLTTTDAVTDTTATADFINNNFAAVEAVVNGNIDNGNINSAAAIAVSKLAAGSSGQLLRTVSGVPTWSSDPITLTKTASDLQVISTTTETTLFTYTVPGGIMGSDRMLRLYGFGDMQDNDATVISVRVKWGGSTIFTSNTQPGDASTRPWYLELDVANQAAAQQYLLGQLIYGASSAGIDSNRVVDGLGISSATKNTASDQVLAVTVQYDSSTANSWFRRRYFVLQLI